MTGMAMERLKAIGARGILAACVIAAAGAAPAQTVAVGSAVVAVNDVTGRVEVETRRIGEGSFVYRNETIATARDSSARLALQDSTNIALGPNAAVKLDQFVALPTGGAGTVVVNATRGILRFVSGNSGSRAYRIRTPHATIGVRGTTFDLEVTATRTRAQLRDGAIDACPNAGACIPVNRPGDIVVIEATGGASAPVPGPAPTLFERYCTPLLCRITASFGGNDNRGEGPGGGSGQSGGGQSGGGRQ